MPNAFILGKFENVILTLLKLKLLYLLDMLNLTKTVNLSPCQGGLY